MDTTLKTALLNAFKSATNSTQKALQKSWEIATWGSRSDKQVLSTIAAIPTSFTTFAMTASKLTHDCSPFGGCPEIALNETFSSDIAFTVAGITATAAYFTTKAFIRAIGLAGSEPKQKTLTSQPIISSPATEKVQETNTKSIKPQQHNSLLTQQSLGDIAIEAKRTRESQHNSPP